MRTSMISSPGNADTRGHVFVFGPLYARARRHTPQMAKPVRIRPRGQAYAASGEPRPPRSASLRRAYCATFMNLVGRLQALADALPDGASITLPATQLRAWLAEEETAPQHSPAPSIVPETGGET